MRATVLISVVILLLLASLLVTSLRGEDIATPTVTTTPLTADHREFAQVLSAVVRADGVDYAALRRDQGALDRYRAQLAATTIPSERAEQLALYINAYNAWTLALVAQKLPRDPASWSAWSIKKAGGWTTSVWKYYTFELAGKRYTLDQLEHAILRPFGEPRIHFAINCASRSCPPLIAQPFIATTLDAQLEAVSVAFATSPYHVRLVDSAVQVNPILSWFGDDFAAGGGVSAFLAKRATPAVRERLTAGVKPGFFAYDWSLNLAAASTPASTPAP